MIHLDSDKYIIVLFVSGNRLAYGTKKCNTFAFDLDKARIYDSFDSAVNVYKSWYLNDKAVSIMNTDQIFMYHIMGN